MTDARVALDPQVQEHRILAEQVALMCRLTTSPLLGSILIGAILAYLAAAEAGASVSIGWYCAALTVVAIRWQVARRYLQCTREYTEVRRWRSGMLLLIVLFGAIWSIPAGFLLPADPIKETVMSVVFIGATATGLGSLSPVRHAYAALLIPFTLPYGLGQLLQGGDRLLIGIAFLLYLPVMIVIANRQSDSVERQIRLAIENETLADALRHERDRANQTNQELQVQVEQQRQFSRRITSLNHNLELQAAELRAANKDLEGFSYSVSHDLRAPLRAIDGFSRLIEAQAVIDDSSQVRHYFLRIHENVVRMSELIDDLLAFSRCGRQPVEMHALQMEELVQQAVNEARSAHVTLAPPEITIERLPSAKGDHHLILQVWVNLIDNAVKYSSKVNSPQITVRGREEADRTVYEVIDNGVGFDSRYSSTLFGVFRRLHAAHEYPGTGVGLAIVERIVTRHGGEVRAQSEVGQGATFAFSLPKSAVTAQPIREDSLT